MPSLLKRKPAQKEKPNEAKKAPGEVLKKPDERPVPGPNALKQSENSFLAFTIQRRHDGVTFLYELVLVRIDKTTEGKATVTEVRRDTGTMREIVESKIFRDLSEIVF